MPDDARLERFVLHGRTQGPSPGLSVDIVESITDAILETTMEGADTLTVTLEDEDWKLLRSDLLTRWTWGDTDFQDRMGWIRKGRAVDVQIPDGDSDRWFRLVKVSKAGTALTLTFEDRMVTYLRHHKGARKLSRNKGTRAMFIRILAEEVKADDGVPTFIPELTVKQPISKPVTDAERDADGKPGMGKTKKLYIADANGGRRLATKAERRIMERAQDAASSVDAGEKATLALIEAIMIESGFRNLEGGDRDSRGVLQVRDKTARGMGLDNRNVEEVCKAFLLRGYWGRGGAIEIAKRAPSESAGWVAQQTQGSAYPDRYDAVAKEARAIIDAYGGSGGRVNAESYSKAYEFARGNDEDSWTAMGRLAEEVHWRRFIRKGRLWYVSEEYLFNQRAAMEIDPEDDPAVEGWDFDLDIEGRDPIAQVTVQARVNLWKATPGMVVELGHCGPVSGRWLVSATRRSLFDDLAEITLTKPVDKLPEPPHEVGTRQSTEALDESGEGSKAEQAYYASERLDQMDLPYLWGGGHTPAQFAHPKGPPPGLDCSGSVCWVLKQAGMFDGNAAVVSGELEKWGKPGKGKHMTVWANAGHTFIEFDLPGKPGKSMDTRRIGDTRSGPHVRKALGPTAGFTARHWPGT